MVTYLGDLSSVSGGIINKFQLNREMCAEALRRLSANRALQSTLRSVLCATRFKYFHKGGLLRTVCQYCGQLDSLPHLLSCVNMGPHPEDPQVLAEYIVELARRAYNVNPKLPVPCWEGDSAEMEIEVVGTGTDDEELQLEFEQDANENFDKTLLRTLGEGDIEEMEEIAD